MLPKPKSMKSDSTRTRFDDSDVRPSANANETRKDLPPESEWTERCSSPMSWSITISSSVLQYVGDLRTACLVLRDAGVLLAGGYSPEFFGILRVRLHSR